MPTAQDRATNVSGYDATATSGAARSTVSFPTNSRIEHSRFTRRTLQERGRGLEGNFGFATRVKRMFGRRIAGKGIFPFPVTKDKAWNALAKHLFERWASNPAIYSIDASRDFWEDQRIAAEELGGGDGEFFNALVKVGEKPKNDKDRDTRLPMIQPLDPFEIETPYGIAGNTASLFEDGVRTDSFLRPISFAVCELAAPLAGYAQRGFREVAAQDMVHVFRRRRAKQLRGLPPVYSVLNDGIDALDTLSLEKATAKLHAALGIARTRKAGSKGNAGLGSQINKILDANGDKIRTEEVMPQGAAILDMDEGETLQFLTSNRPSLPVIEGIEFYCHMIAMGVDLPVSILLELGGNGTAVRGDMEDAQNCFEMLQDQLVWRMCQRIYTWRIAVALKNGELPKCQDPYWSACDWQGPAKLTVDYGRTANANIDLMKAGLLSAYRYYDERGLDADAEGKKQIDWLANMATACAEKGVPFERFMEATPGAGAQPPGGGKPKPKEEEE